jgi:polyribonucleotide nucleotidyltransferase
MVEGGGKFVSESDMIDAIFFGHEAMQPMLDLQEDLKKAVGKEKRVVPEVTGESGFLDRIAQAATPLLREVITTADKLDRQKKREKAQQAVLELLGDDDVDRRSTIKDAIHDIERETVREMILKDGRRIDGRSFSEVRPIDCVVGILPRVHGSALFTRGETQAMVLATLGTEFDEQKIESIYGDHFRSFILHYNFPPYSVGEAKRLGGPGRREIGHGALARRALIPVMPNKDEFTYCTRVVSEIMESNGSSSMASVCGASLSLMDAGVPIKEPVAGVAMGLVSDNTNVAVLTDIIGDEDHYGDMDFKVAGTRDGITALQMDIKMEGITRDILGKALEQAREARLFILDKMSAAIPRPRTQVSQYAPVVIRMEIKTEKIRSLIGPGGKTIKQITADSGARVEVDDDGNVVIAAADQESADAAVEMINEIVKEAEIGKLYMGKVRKIMDFGAFVEILPGTDGLVHISQLDRGRVEKVTDVLKEGDEVLVKVLDVDDHGKIRLSRKAALGENPDDVS